MTGAAAPPPSAEGPLIADRGFDAVTRQIGLIPVDYPTRRRWWIGFGVSALFVGVFLVSVIVLFAEGVGVWGINIPVNWGIAISNTVWWIGIGHAGTFISAMLLLTQQDWRNSLNRFAEAMTLFAATCAVMYPVLHLGRPFYFYFMIPYPSMLQVWPQFRSPLVWDLFAFFAYLTVSLIFWYVGLVPDLASVRDRTRKRRWQVFFGVLALGWRGEAAAWVRWRRTYVLLAVLAMPLVVSVHSGVSLLFAGGPVPGWNTSVFPPYFVLGAVFSGFAVVILIAATLRAAFGLGNLVTQRHMELLGLFLLTTGLMTGYGYVMDSFTAWYAGGYELRTLVDRVSGSYAPTFWGAVLLNFVPLQLLWARRWRRSTAVLVAVAIAVTVGMWLERYMLVVTGLYQDYLPSSFGGYHASFWEWSLFLGLIGLFFFLFFVFVRLLPQISIFELKEVLRHQREGGRHGA